MRLTVLVKSVLVSYCEGLLGLFATCPFLCPRSPTERALLDWLELDVLELMAASLSALGTSFTLDPRSRRGSCSSELRFFDDKFDASR